MNPASVEQQRPMPTAADEVTARNPERVSVFGALRRRSDRWSLQWKVFALNATVFILAFAIVAWTPVTVHRVATWGEVLVLALVLAGMLTCDFLLLQRAFRPLRKLASAMRTVDSVLADDHRESFDGASAEVRLLADALDGMLDRLEQERRDGALRELAAQERERLRVARELHDEVGQMLTAIALRAERAAEGTSGAQRAALLEISEAALGSLDDVRRIGRELRPEALDDLGLVNAIIALCGRVDRHRGIRVQRELEWSLPELAPEVELVIYRVAQEALTNVLRHSNASEVLVELRREEFRVVLVVADNGRGVPADAEERGMQGMRERAAVINAELDVRGRAEGGTRVVLGVPV